MTQCPTGAPRVPGGGPTGGGPTGVRELGASWAQGV